MSYSSSFDQKARLSEEHSVSDTNYPFKLLNEEIDNFKKSKHVEKIRIILIHLRDVGLDDIHKDFLNCIDPAFTLRCLELAGFLNIDHKLTSVGQDFINRAVNCDDIKHLTDVLWPIYKKDKAFKKILNELNGQWKFTINLDEQEEVRISSFLSKVGLISGYIPDQNDIVIPTKFTETAYYIIDDHKVRQVFLDLKKRGGRVIINWVLKNKYVFWIIQNIVIPFVVNILSNNLKLKIKILHFLQS